MRSAGWVACCVACAALAGPGCVAEIRADDYAQECSTDDECTAVYQGNVCMECGIDNAAIRVDEWERYADDVAQLREAACFPELTSPYRRRCDATMHAVCTDGRCAVAAGEGQD
ncbi:MAG: hypothetical protein IT383_23805 [Deltaproteobacteria bacterium]|nr:hypothetical protein [Deltaproteobacteria bacterium]